MPTMRLEIITAERLVYAAEVSAVVAPGIEGELGILPHHAPLITILKPGELRIRKDDTEEYLVVGGGFMEVLANKVIILADAAERAEEIDEHRAEAAMRRAQELLARREADLDLEQAMAALHRSQARLKVAQRRRPRRPGSAPGPEGPGQP